jgi:hypothetical protein
MTLEGDYIFDNQIFCHDYGIEWLVEKA